MRRYKMDKGSLPEKLDDLVPAYLEAVPRDDFDGRPLRYSAAKKVIYSVGKNLVDDGGEGAAFDEVKFGESSSGHGLSDPLLNCLGGRRPTSSCQ